MTKYIIVANPTPDNFTTKKHMHHTATLLVILLSNMFFFFLQQELENTCHYISGALEHINIELCHLVPN